MWGDMSLWNVQGPLLHSGDHIVPRILTVDYTFNPWWITILYYSGLDFGATWLVEQNNIILHEKHCHLVSGPDT